MTDLPPGVEAFDPATSRTKATTNVVCAVFGAPKTGKTYFALHSPRPAYVAYLDPNTNLDFHLLNAAEDIDPETEEPYGNDVYKQQVVPMLGKPYSAFTQADADKIITDLEAFADWARMRAAEEVEAGRPGGTFILDGGVFLKGYYEKQILGESVTLGYRPKPGERSGISTYDYAKSNAALFEFMTQFMLAPMDMIMVWEGRRIWQSGFDQTTGKKSSNPTDKFRATWPDRMPYGMSTAVETMKIVEPVVVNNETVGSTTRAVVRNVWSAFSMELDNQVLPIESFSELRQVLLGDVLDAMKDDVVDGESVIRANSEGFVEDDD